MTPFPLAFAVVACLLFLASNVVAIPDTDVLIIGAGTSRCVLAARLCAGLPHFHFTLVERAKPRSKASDFAVRARRIALTTLDDPQLFEIFLSEPEPSLGNRVFPILTGATKGGSSSVNGMQWGIPLAGDVDGWGVNGLGEHNAETYFRRVFEKVGFARLREDDRQIYNNDLLDAAKRAGFEAEDRSGAFDRRARKTIYNVQPGAYL